MEQIAIHSLIKLRNLEAIHASTLVPEWVKEMLKLTPYVIVRRGDQGDSIPVGIRGFEKKQRFAADILPSNVAEIVTPKQALHFGKEIETGRQELPPFRTLERLEPLLKEWSWGIGGSLGFELVTGVHMVRADSDIDVIMELPAEKITATTAQELVNRIKSVATVHVDIQVVHGQGGFSLEEFAEQRSTKILVKTAEGPVLEADPWQFLAKQ